MFALIGSALLMIAGIGTPIGLSVAALLSNR